MAENVYEGMFILDANRFSREPDVISGRIAKLVQAAGGEMLVSRLWEERRLAYPVKGHRKGAYWLTYFRLDPSKLSELNRNCQLDEAILRFLFLKVDPRIVDALVAHAQAGAAGRPHAEPAPVETARGEGKASEDGEGAGKDREKQDAQAAK